MGKTMSSTTTSCNNPIIIHTLRTCRWADGCHSSVLAVFKFFGGCGLVDNVTRVDDNKATI